MAPTDTWSDPIAETNKYGYPTGNAYVQCTDCGIEVLTGHTDNVDPADHREGCGERTVDDRPDEDCVVIR